MVLMVLMVLVVLMMMVLLVLVVIMILVGETCVLQPCQVPDAVRISEPIHIVPHGRPQPSYVPSPFLSWRRGDRRLALSPPWRKARRSEMDFYSSREECVEKSECCGENKFQGPEPEFLGVTPRYRHVKVCLEDSLCIFDLKTLKLDYLTCQLSSPSSSSPFSSPSSPVSP